jgi:flagellar basal-body rod protein FlgB
MPAAATCRGRQEIAGRAPPSPAPLRAAPLSVPVFRRGTALAPSPCETSIAEAHVPLDLDSHLGSLPAALQLQSRRTEVIAANLANADTPNYKARDLDFRAALAEANGQGATLRLDRTSPHHLTTAGTAARGDAPLLYRTPLAPALDGNTVDSHLEQAAFAENAVRYQATLTFLNAKFRSLMTAITGQ